MGRPGEVSWTLVGPAGANQRDVDSGRIRLPADGSWTLTLEAPEEPGLYGVFGADGAIGGIECTAPEGGRTHLFAFVLFNVAA